MAQRNSAAHAAKLTAAEAKVALGVRQACAATAHATHAARVAKATSVATALATRVYVPTKALPYVHPVDMSGARNVVRLARAASLQAVLAMRAMRMADARIAAVKARAIKAATPATATTTATTTARSTTADVRATRAAIVAFLAMTPCLCALWFYATFDIAARAADKEAAKVANRAHARIRAPRVPMNTPEKRASITMACNAVRAAVHAAQAKTGTSISNTKVQARLAQGAAQRAANAARKAGMPTKTPRPHVVIVRSGPVKNNGAKRVKAPRVHTVESALDQVAKKAAIIKAKEDALIAKAKKWALRKEAYANRKAAMEVIASDAWMNAGIWLPEDLIRGANDWSYQVRIAAFKEARAIAYPPKTKAVATTGVAA